MKEHISLTCVQALFAVYLDLPRSFKALECQNKRSIYEGYQNAAQIEDIPLPATAQEQEARFEAITSKMSMQVQDLEQQLHLIFLHITF